MSELVRNLIDKAAEDHVLKCAPADYVAEFAAALRRVYPAERVEEVLRSKFSVREGGRIGLDAYFQYAAELSVQNHLMQHQAATAIAPEKRVNPPKDVDVAYAVGGVNVALEVKCAVEPADPAGAVVVRTAGRVPGYQAAVGGLRDAIQSGDPGYTVAVAKNKDNALKDFLLSAQGKFAPDPGIADLNVLLVTCGGYSSLQNWHNYLLGEQGLFTGDPFHPPSEFDLVDVVVLSSLKYCHSHGRPWHRWTLDDAFILPVLNPAPRKTLLSSSVIKGLSVFTHHLQRFGEFTPLHAPGVPQYIFNRVKVIHYIKEDRGLTAAERQTYFPAGMEAGEPGDTS